MKLHYACKDINNFGDIVPLYVYKRLGIRVKWSTADKAHVIAGGSIMQDVTENNRVLCTGFGADHEICDMPKKIISVRGPLTRQRLLELKIDCPEVYGDMIDLLPSIYNPGKSQIHELGYLPHYCDYEGILWDNFTERKEGRRIVYDTKVPVIDIKSGVENVINEVLKCKKIMTSSLHGIILCQTYGIPWEWFRLNEIASPDFKFQDYFERIGLKGQKPIQL